MVSKKRRAIMDSLMKLLDKKPLDKITVRDIVEDCGINRNTFYYHFEDITAVIEETILEEADGIMKDYSDRNAVYHIYNSSNRDFLVRRLMEICKYISAQFVDRTAEGIDIRPEDRDIIVQSYKCEFYGYIIDWLNEGMDESALTRVQRLCELRAGSTMTLLERCRLK